MKRVLLVGYDPKSVDFSDLALPPRMTAEKIYAGVQVALKQMTERGWESDCCSSILIKRLAPQWNVSWRSRLMIAL
jgi:hypothetical protein